MSLPGLPPLPKSLSGFEGSQNKQNISNSFYQSAANEQQQQQQQNNRFGGGNGVSVSRKPSSLDNQLAILRREMFSLRQLDQSLLSQLWTLNESIQEFRNIMNEQETLSPPSPSPTPSDTNSMSSSDEAEEQTNGQLLNRVSYQAPLKVTPGQQRMRIAPPPPPSNRKPATAPRNG